MYKGKQQLGLLLFCLVCTGGRALSSLMITCLPFLKLYLSKLLSPSAPFLLFSSGKNFLSLETLLPYRPKDPHVPAQSLAPAGGSNSCARFE